VDAFSRQNDPVRVGLRELVAVRAALDSLEAELVIQARRRGYRWRELGADLGLSAHGARKRHVARDPIAALRQPREPMTFEELREALAGMTPARC
jgi:hypothetical protein